MAAEWFASESDLHSWRRELDRLKRRARARLFRTLVVAALAAAAVVWVAGRRVPLAESRILIRVTEGTVLREDSPTTTRDLAQFLRDVALSSRKLTEIIQKRGLYPLERMRGERFALDELRDNLKLEVYRNQFIEARGYNDDVRTARISLRFFHDDPALSFAVASDLARLIIESESQRREATSRDVVGLTRGAVDSAQAALAQRQSELSAARVALARARRLGRKEEVAALQVDISRLTADLQGRVRMVTVLRQNNARAELRHALDTGQLNMRYQIVDERPPVPPPPGKEIRLAMMGLAVFLILLPLCAIGVGAFDSRIHDREDVQRLGVEVVGHVPRFAGFRVGSLRDRRGGERRRTRFRMT